MSADWSANDSSESDNDAKDADASNDAFSMLVFGDDVKILGACFAGVLVMNKKFFVT